MLPRLRVKRTREPLLETSNISAPAAVEEHEVCAVLAFHGVVAVARVPLEGIIAAAEEDHVIALLAIEEVVVVTPEQDISAVAPKDRVRAGAAIDGDLDQGREIAGG